MHYFISGGEHKDANITVGIVEYIDDGKVVPVLPEEIQFLDTKGKAMGYCWDDRTGESEWVMARKSDYDKETPFTPTEIMRFDVASLGGRTELEGICKCGQCVSQYENYCHECGQKLDWPESEGTHE